METRFDCPRDLTPLERRDFRGVEYGLCPRCEGLWFTRDALAAPVLSSAATVAPRRPAPSVDPALPVQSDTPCPACRAPALRPFRVAEAVVDICRRCGGLWLDAPEFDAVAPAYRAWRAGVSRWNDEARPGVPLQPDPRESPDAGASEADAVYDFLYMLLEASLSGGDASSSGGSGGSEFGGGGGFSGGGSSGTA